MKTILDIPATPKIDCKTKVIHSFITEIYIAPLQGYYSDALPTLARQKEEF